MKAYTRLVTAAGLAVMMAGCGHHEKPIPLEDETPVAVAVAPVESAVVPVLIK